MFLASFKKTLKKLATKIRKTRKCKMDGDFTASGMYSNAVRPNPRDKKQCSKQYQAINKKIKAYIRKNKSVSEYEGLIREYKKFAKTYSLRYGEKKRRSRSSARSSARSSPRSESVSSQTDTLIQEELSALIPAKVVDPLKIVDIYIVAHGGELLNYKLSEDSISNTFVNNIGKLNLCQVGYGLISAAEGTEATGVIKPDSFSQVWSIVDYLRDQFGKSPPSVVNESIARIYANEPVKSYTVISEEKESYVKQRERTDRIPEEYMRSFQYQKRYSLHNNQEEDLMGVWIVGTHNVSPELTEKLMEPFRGLEDDTVFEKVRANNLINKKNYDALLRRFSLSKHPLLEDLLDLEPHSEETPLPLGWMIRMNPETGMNYYSNFLTGKVQFDRPETEKKIHQIFRLSELLKLFQLLGFDHVNIIEDSCRTVINYGNLIPETLVRQISREEKESYQSKLDERRGRGFG